MPQPPLRIKPHLTHEEITKRYRKCKQGREKSYWHLIWLMADPKKEILITEAAQIVGFCQRWARILVNRYNQEGAENLIDQRRNNEGRQPILNDSQQEALKKALTKQKPPGGGLWTGPRVAVWIKKRTKKNITPQGAWNWIVKSGFTLQVPRPKNIKAATEKEMKGFKKNWILNS